MEKEFSHWKIDTFFFLSYEIVTVFDFKFLKIK